MKKIALIMESWMHCFTFAWPSGMLKTIKELGADINLYIFNSSANWNKDAAYNHGEHNIFRLPNLTDYDGIVLDLNNVADPDAKDFILKRAAESGVPTIIIGNQYPGFYSVAIDNYGAMTDIMSHLHEHHNSQSFWFLMGHADNYENQQRELAIRDYIKNHAIAEENCHFYYDTFEFHSGVRGFHALKKQGLALPDAIVCINDNIAAGALTAASEYGLTAPRDFIITGFDDLDKARFFNPRISTISHIREEIGSACIELFMRIWNGETPDRITLTKTTPIFWESCGCTSDIHIDVREHLKNDILYNVETSDFNASILALKHQLLYCSTVQDMLYCISDCMPSLKCDAMYLVMDRHIEHNTTTAQDTLSILSSTKEPFLTEGYPEDMTFAFSYENPSLPAIHAQGHQARDIFPLFDCEESGVNFLFIPIHFRDYCVGYFAIRNAIYLMEKQFLFEIINALTSALEQLYSKSCLARVNHALSVLYNHDSMTMLYNRLALEEYGIPLLEKAHNSHTPLCVTYIDLDLLKYINDTFGHEMGDFSIKTVASILLKHTLQEGLSFRLGGDEFLMLEPLSSSAEIEQRITTMQEELHNIEITNKLPFELSISVGYVITNPNSDTSLDDYIKQADDIMYQSKLARKKHRTN